MCGCWGMTAGQAAACKQAPTAPRLACREPAVVAAFAAVARYRDHIGGTVKITAVEPTSGRSGQGAVKPELEPGTVNLLAFPAGKWACC